jgi:predicted ATPase/DNA-binding SARP family transcriptional activator
VVRDEHSLLFSVLGPLRVERPDSEVRVGGVRRRTVLLRLLASVNQVVPTELLAEDVWEGSPPAAAVSTLQSHVSALRQQLGADRLAYVHGGYCVRVQAAEFDVALFEADVGHGRAQLAEGAFDAAVEAFERGLGRWRGSALADVAGAGWALAPSAHLEEERNGALEDALEARLAMGLHHEVCLLAEAAVAAEPFRERRWEALMLALYRAGRQADALRAYQRAREKLADELGIEPSPSLVRLEQDILFQSAALAWDGQRPSSAGATPVLVRVAGDDEARTNLPVPVSRFVGRERELAELDKLLGAHRLVTIVGTGGIGKTRLAMEVAGTRVGEFRDGVWFVDLTAVPDPDGLPAAVAAALGVRSASDEAPQSLLLERARDMRALVVLDNCEHVISTTAALVERLLEGAPGIRVLATSRESLRVPGEKLWPAPPIATPGQDSDDLDPDALAGFDAIRLFIERAGDSTGLESTGAAELRLIARITGRLDGLPLAIELAAARAGSVGLDELAVLDDRLGVVGSGSRTARGRHQTLEATIDWSYRLLAVDLRAALRKLSVFVGGFTIEAARAVAGAEDGDDTAMAEAVACLVERSLLGYSRWVPAASSSRGLARYTMLETIRQFAARRLDQEDGSQGEGLAKRAHSRYFAELASRASGALVGRQQGRWFDTLELEYANIEAAIGYLLEGPAHAADALAMIVHLNRFWHNRGRLAQCSTLLRRALDLAEHNIDPDLRCGALILAGQASAQREPSAAIANLTESLSLAREIGNDYHAALALAGLSWATHRHGDTAASRRTGGEGVDLARGVGDPVLLGECLIAYGLSTVEDFPLGQSVYTEAITVTRSSGDRTHLAWAHNNLANALLAQRDWTGARQHLDEATAILAEIGAPMATPLINLGWVHLHQGQFDTSLESFGQSLRIARRCQALYEGAYALLGLGCAAAAESDYQRAGALLGFADSELQRCAPSWAEPERSYRQSALAHIAAHLGSGADAAYDSGRAADREEMLDAILERAPYRSP